MDTKKQFCQQYPQFLSDPCTEGILRCEISLEEVVRQMRVCLETVTAPGCEQNPYNKPAEQSYRAFLQAVEG